MATERISHELLAHFDRPKLADCPDFEWDQHAVAADAFEWATPLTARTGDSAESRETPIPSPPLNYTRGVRWVLQWAAAAAVLMVAANVLREFAYAFAAERSLMQAASAGATEATLPRATQQTVVAAIERRLSDSPRISRQLTINLLQNGKPINGPFAAGDDDRFTIILSAPSCTRTPMFAQDMRPIVVRADRIVPGRRLKQ